MFFKFIYVIFSVFPFGSITVMRMDLYHQYGPLFAELYDRVVEHKSFIYSWQSGGGSSFDPASDYNISGKWKFTQPLKIAEATVATEAVTLGYVIRNYNACVG